MAMSEQVAHEAGQAYSIMESYAEQTGCQSGTQRMSSKSLPAVLLSDTESESVSNLSEEELTDDDSSLSREESYHSEEDNPFDKLAEGYDEHENGYESGDGAEAFRLLGCGTESGIGDDAAPL